MAECESDSDLEFESADENQELSDLDIDEILNDDKIKKNDSFIEQNLNIQKDSNQSKENNEIKNYENEIQSQNGQNQNQLIESPKDNITVEQSLKELNIEESEIGKQFEREEKNDQTQKKQVDQSGWDLDADFEGIENDVSDSFIENKNLIINENIKNSIIKQENFNYLVEKKLENNLIEQNVENNLKKEIPDKESKWGWSSIFSTAANITSKVGEGLNTVLNTVEAGIGAPDPTKLAAEISKTKNENLEIEENEQIKSADDWSFDNSGNDSEWFSLSKIQNIKPTGFQLVSSGLNVLEAVGKKTIGLISEKDPNFEQTRSLLNKVPSNIVSIPKQPSLSQILREAKSNEVNDQQVPPNLTNKSRINDKNFDSFFEDFNGKLHMEALEILSREIEVKVDMSLLEKKLDNIKRKNINELNDIFDGKNLDDDSENDYLELLDEKILESNPICNQHDKSLNLKNVNIIINFFTENLSFNITFDKLQQALCLFLSNIESNIENQQIKKQSIEFYASLAAKMTELIHKTAQSIIRESKFLKQDDVIEAARNLLRVIRVFVKSVSVLADYLSRRCKNSSESWSQSKELNQVITDIYLEASNCNTIISDAFSLLLPIFKNQLLSI